MVEITNTISFAYPTGSAKPTMDELAKFVKTLDANIGDMIAMYRIGEEQSVFIKFRSEASMQYALTHNPEKVAFKYADGKVVELRMALAGGNVQYVRVYDLPHEVPDNEVVSVFEKYGKVKRVVRERFPVELGLNLFSGVRGVYLDVEKEIPSSLTFDNRRGNIYYSGNKDTCFRCKKQGHRMNSCPARKIREQQQQQQQQQNLVKETNTDEGTALENISHGQEEEEYEEVIHEEVVKTDEMDMEVAAPAVVPKEAETTQKRVFKNQNDAYYFYKFGILDYTEKEKAKNEEWEEKERQRQKAAQTLRSPSRKNKKLG